MMNLTEREGKELDDIRERDAKLRDMLARVDPPIGSNPTEWFQYFVALRNAQGHVSNALAYLSTLLAKQFLARSFNIVLFDAAAKAQGANGLDIDIMLDDGQRISGEIKTTRPVYEHNFGAAQRREILKDCERLATCDSE